MNLLQNLLMNVKAPLLDRTAYIAQPGFSGDIEEHYELPIWAEGGENTRHDTFYNHIAYDVELSTDWQTPLEITPTVRKLVDMVLSDDGWVVNTGEDVDTGTYEIVIASDACRAISFETGIATNVALYRPHKQPTTFWRGKAAVPDQDQADFNEMGCIAEQHKSGKLSDELINNLDMLETFDTDVLIDELLKRCEDVKAPSSYHRKITKRALLNRLYMDSYDIDAMWPLPGNLSPLQHARKKALAPGSRGEGHKSIHKDLKEIAWSTAEAVETFKE
ncbi:MAG: hypothetical protein PF440_00440 [Thiomicrorhabdus sp.]|jgi:hypothetical protein|nr:hypothetical protein [Thiomicrorhabdus sp.]